MVGALITSAVISGSPRGRHHKSGKPSASVSKAGVNDRPLIQYAWTFPSIVRAHYHDDTEPCADIGPER